MSTATPWPARKRWRRTRTTAPSAGSPWRRPGNCPARICSISKCSIITSVAVRSLSCSSGFHMHWKSLPHYAIFLETRKVHFAWHWFVWLDWNVCCLDFSQIFDSLFCSACHIFSLELIEYLLRKKSWRGEVFKKKLQTRTWSMMAHSLSQRHTIPPPDHLDTQCLHTQFELFLLNLSPGLRHVLAFSFFVWSFYVISNFDAWLFKT